MNVELWRSPQLGSRCDDIRTQLRESGRIRTVLPVTIGGDICRRTLGDTKDVKKAQKDVLNRLVAPEQLLECPLNSFWLV